MVSRNENNGHRGEDDRQSGRTLRRAGAAAVGLLLVGGIAANRLADGEAFPLQGDAATIAERYNCNLTTVEDQKDASAALDRSTVNLGVDLATKTDPATVAALARYENDDALWWKESQLAGVLYDENVTLDRMPMVVSPVGLGFEDGRYTKSVGVDIDYPEGTQLLVTLNSEVNTFENDDHVAHSQVCGAVILRGGEWQAVDPADVPAVEPRTIPYEN